MHPIAVGTDAVGLESGSQLGPEHQSTHSADQQHERTNATTAFRVLQR